MYSEHISHMGSLSYSAVAQQAVVRQYLLWGCGFEEKPQPFSVVYFAKCCLFLFRRLVQKLTVKFSSQIIGSAHWRESLGTAQAFGQSSYFAFTTPVGRLK